MNVRIARRFAATLALCLLSATAAGALAAAGPAADRSHAATPTVLVFGLGERCAYCLQLKQEISKVTQLTGDAVKFDDYLVNRDVVMVQRYRVELSPTLVFLDASGAEVFRHQGLMDAAQIREKLETFKLWADKR